MTTEYLKNVVGQIREGEHPKIHLVHGNLRQDEIAALYHHRKIKAFAIATRGEGYGLPLIESAAAGLPVIATNWSGHLEFLNRDNFYPVDYELVDIPDEKIDNRIFMQGTRWADPKEESFIDQVNKVYHFYDEAKENSKKMKKEIVLNFNAAAINKKYDKVLKEVF
jgi:glycosyltransferase involved in cell wall biosynthesis